MRKNLFSKYTNKSFRTWSIGNERVFSRQTKHSKFVQIQTKTEHNRNAINFDSKNKLTFCWLPTSPMCNDSIQITKFSFIYPGFYAATRRQDDKLTKFTIFIRPKEKKPITDKRFNIKDTNDTQREWERETHPSLIAHKRWNNWYRHPFTILTD